MTKLYYSNKHKVALSRQNSLNYLEMQLESGKVEL